MAFPALAGAIAALTLPGPSGTISAGAAFLAVGAIAILAGHTWGLMVAVPAHITLVGRLWPLLVREPSATVGIVVVTALPALALTAIILPQIARHLLADRPARTRAWFVAGSALALALSLVLPAIALFDDAAETSAPHLAQLP